MKKFIVVSLETFTGRILYGWLIITLLLPVFSIVLTSQPADVVRAQPLLLEMAAAQPERPLRVIVQKTTQSANLESLVAHLGGVVLKKLPLINAFAAQVPADAIPELAQAPGIQWVSLDAPMVESVVETWTVRDEFNANVYSNNDGTVGWAGEWVEFGDDGSPTSGYVKVRSGSLRLQNAGRAIMRGADLSGAEFATLTFDVWKRGLSSPLAFVSVEISTDGGVSWAEIDRFVGPLYERNFTSVSYDISSYIAGNTVIRFRSSDALLASDILYFDNVQIEFTGGSGTGGGTGTDLLTVRDDLEVVAYNNNDGTALWNDDWLEIGEGDGPASGRVRIFNMPGNNSLGLLMIDANIGIERSVNLSGAVYARLSFDYVLAALEDPADYVVLQISADGGGSWTELDRFSGPAEPTVSGSATYNIAPYISADTRIRFLTSPTFALNDRFYIDSIQVEFNDGTAPLNTFLDTLGVRAVWDMGFDGTGIGVAVVDSGVTTDKDFEMDPDQPSSGSRVVAQVNFNTASTFMGDSHGHGTHIAGIIGGSGYESSGIYTGVAPGVHLIGLKISDDSGMAYESDTVEALQWVLDHKDLYNIRVVNLSINSAVEGTYNLSPLNAATEILWFNGIVVVASAGNVTGSGNPINAAPANDPFVITVGASLEHGTADRSDDTIATFSASGTTLDGFAKPDIIAPGKDIVSVLASNSQWAANYPERAVIGRQYFRISGTSMAAPMVTGAVALLLQAEPNLTPDQVKYRLMHSGSIIGDGATYPYLDIYAALTTPTTDRANMGIKPHDLLAKMALIAYWSSNDCGNPCDWSSVDWSTVNWDSVNWDSVNWDTVNWDNVNWNAVNWDSVNWDSVNWDSVNWDSVNWDSVNWDSVNWDSVNWDSVNWGSVDWSE